MAIKSLKHIKLFDYSYRFVIHIFKNNINNIKIFENFFLHILVI